ncbi:TVP38/TMEM64 family protein [Nitrospirota bacterium]
MDKKRKNIGRLILVVVIAALVGAFFIFDLGEYLSLQMIKGSQEAFQTFYADNQFLVLGIYMGIYIVVTALSLPGAAVLTLAGGGIFGILVGFIAVSISSTIGATLACAVSRFILRDWVQGRFGDKLAPINRGIENEGSFYLFTLRLIPIFPFFIINLVMGLTRMPLRTFFWVSQVGMLPGTVLFVNAGRELAKIETLAGILSPSLLISFALLGIFPLAVKKIVASVRAKRSGNA